MLEHNLASVLSTGSDHLHVSDSGKSDKVDSLGLMVSSEFPELDDKELLDSGGNLSTESSSFVISSLHVDSTLFSLESLVVSDDVSDSDSELAGNSSPVFDSSHEVSVLDSGVSSDSVLCDVDTSHLDGDLSLEVSLFVVVNSSSLVLSSHFDG